jgi:hypothetical protein
VVLELTEEKDRDDNDNEDDEGISIAGSVG